MAFTADHHQAFISCHTKKPGTTRSAIFQRIGPSEQLQEGFVDGILSSMLVFEYAQAEAKERYFVALVQKLECPRVPGAESVKEFTVGNGFQSGILSVRYVLS
jgi:hypothetical protein